MANTGRWWWLVGWATLAVVGCGGDDDSATDGSDGDFADADALAEIDVPLEDAGDDTAAGDEAAGDDGTSDDGDDDDDGSDPLPADIRPCDAGACWTTGEAWAPPCGYAPVSENYETGAYNVHEYQVVLYHDAPIRITVERTAGDWQPAIIVVTEGGEVVSDGRVGLHGAELGATIVLDGRTGAQAVLELTASTDTPASIFVTGWGAIDSGFVEFQPTSARYALLVESLCVATDNVECTAESLTISDRECAWLHYIARYVMPRLEGTRDERLDAAAAGGWWTFKEAVLRLIDNPLAYSNCNFTTGDEWIGPIDLCPEGRAWQVGLAAVQVPNYSDTAVAAVAARLYPGEAIPDVLAESARVAHLDASTAASVVGSTDYLRRSWLLRTSPIGFTLVAADVIRECVDRTSPWCPDGARTRAGIADVRAILAAVAP